MALIKKNKWIIFILSIALVAWRGYYAWEKSENILRDSGLSFLDGLKVDYILNSEEAVGLPSPIYENFEVNLLGNILLRCDTELLELEPYEKGVYVAKVELCQAAPESFTFDMDSSLLAISGHFLGQLEDSIFTMAIPLPSEGMRIKASSNAGTIYLLGGMNNSANRLYTLNRDGTFTIIAELPDSIISVCDSKDFVYISTNSEIYSVSPKAIELVIRLPEDAEPIISIESNDEILYYSTAKKVFALHGFAALSIVNNAGGTLRFRNDNLYLFDKRQNILLRISHLKDALLKLPE